MLKSIIELIPFGRDSDSKPIAGLYICNSGIQPGVDGLYLYIVGYYELPCEFNQYKQVELYNVLRISRSEGLMHLLKNILGNTEDWFNFEDEYIQCLWLEHALMMQQRAMKDGCYA